MMPLKKIRGAKIAAGVLLCLMSLTFVQAETLFYRYKDQNGTLVLGNSVPPEAAKKGYQIVDAFGRVIKDIPAALTPEQIIERDRKLAEKAQKEEEVRKQREADELLLRLFSHPDDAARARDRKLQELDGLISLKRNNIEVLEKKVASQESRAADAERAGRAVPQDLLDEIQRDTSQVQRLQSEIAAHEKDREETTADYAQKIERLKFLLEKINN
ncbi:ABC transporter ATPase [Hahella sp. HN01]|nr:ABC transporter ATPase [Hahella sp. HN01]